MSGQLAWSYLGRVEYGDGLELQKQFQEALRAKVSGDTLLLLEHSPVLTLGRGAHLTNIIAPRDTLAKLGVDVVDTDRGGDVTYHGPGQLVGYPILFLPPGKQDVRKYVRNLEEMIIRTLRDFGITATRFEQWPGVWVSESRAGGPRKICALGVHLSRWHTKHGFALNVQPNLSHFDLIIPCGIKEAGVTSMQQELGSTFPLDEIATRLVRHFGDVFELDPSQLPPPLSTVSVAAVAQQRVLLLKRTEARGGFWQIITGKVERGENAQHAAQREFEEETGSRLLVEALSYEHSFAFGSRADHEAPIVAHETAFQVSADALFSPVLDRSEHDSAEWVSLEEAMKRLPFEGLRIAVRRALTT